MQITRRRTFVTVLPLLLLGLVGHAFYPHFSLAALLPDWVSHYILSTSGGLPDLAFNFTAPMPSWLARSPESSPPLSLRLAFVTHPLEAERRDAIRTNVLSGVPLDEVVFEHSFFVGLTGDAKVDGEMRAEAIEYGDIEILDIPDSKNHLSRKRFAAFLWGANATTDYDYFMTADTDSFIRLAGLARRLRSARPDLNPRKHRIAWGHILSHWWH
jgi:hypothetical protein